MVLRITTKITRRRWLMFMRMSTIKRVIKIISKSIKMIFMKKDMKR